MNKAAFFDRLRQEFGKLSRQQVAGIEAILDGSRHLPRAHRAYILATAWHETGGRMVPVREAFASSDEKAVKILDAAWQYGKLPQVRTPYWRPDDSGRAWFGRGLVQITHRANYAKASQLVGVDLLGNPSLALDPKIAVRILVDGMEKGLFTGRKLSEFMNAKSKDYVGARQVVNGRDRAMLIAGYAEKFERALMAGRASAGEQKQPQTLRPAPNPAGTVAAVGAAVAAVVAVAFAKLHTIIDYISAFSGGW